MQGTVQRKTFRSGVWHHLYHLGAYHLGVWINGYDYECGFIPNYAKLAVRDYDLFAQSIRNNPGCRGVVLLDYAGDNEITRVNIYSLATGAVVSYAIGGWYETVMSLFRKRPNRLCLFKGSYDLIESHTPSDKIHSQDLVEEIIKGNFKK